MLKNNTPPTTTTPTTATNSNDNNNSDNTNKTQEVEENNTDQSIINESDIENKISEITAALTQATLTPAATTTNNNTEEENIKSITRTSSSSSSSSTTSSTTATTLIEPIQIALNNLNIEESENDKNSRVHTEESEPLSIDIFDDACQDILILETLLSDDDDNYNYNYNDNDKELLLTEENIDTYFEDTILLKEGCSCCNTNTSGTHKTNNLFYTKNSEDHNTNNLILDEGSIHSFPISDTNSIESEEEEELTKNFNKMNVNINDITAFTMFGNSGSNVSNNNGNVDLVSSVQNKKQKVKERMCIGHKETLFSVSFSSCGELVATASQDATIRVWDSKSNLLLHTLHGHDKKYECLRVTFCDPGQWKCPNLAEEDGYLLASAGADGVIKLWNVQRTECKCLCTLEQTYSESEAPQVYALDFVNWSCVENQDDFLLLTSADDYIYLWEVQPDRTPSPSYPCVLVKVLSFNFVHYANFNHGVSVHYPGCTPEDTQPTCSHHQNTPDSTPFGGTARNPNNLIYVFDITYSLANFLLAVAVSDGTVRLLNTRGVCVCILQLPPQDSSNTTSSPRLTSVTWSNDGYRLASCVANGTIIIWNIHTTPTSITPSCRAVLQGGHTFGRPLFGAKFISVGHSATQQQQQQPYLLSWGIDGNLVLWDAIAFGQVHTPIATVASKSDYPFYAVDVFTNYNYDNSTKDGDANTLICQVAVAGGIDGGILGIPLYLYDIFK